MTTFLQMSSLLFISNVFNIHFRAAYFDANVLKLFVSLWQYCHFNACLSQCFFFLASALVRQHLLQGVPSPLMNFCNYVFIILHLFIGWLGLQDAVHFHFFFFLIEFKEFVGLCKNKLMNECLVFWRSYPCCKHKYIHTHTQTSQVHNTRREKYSIHYSLACEFWIWSLKTILFFKMETLERYCCWKQINSQSSTYSLIQPFFPILNYP